MLDLSSKQILRKLTLLLFLFVFLSLPVLGQDEFLPTIEDTLCPADWLYAGPFSVGAREGIVGVIKDMENFRPQEGQKHPSILSQGGWVEWKKVRVDSLGWVNLEYENVWWDTLMDMYGVAGILDAGYAYTEFVNKSRKRALVIAEKIGSFYLNGKRYRGDPYAHDFVRTPVILEEGTNRVLVSLAGYGDHRFKFKLLPVPAPVMLITKDATLPDVIEKKKERLWAGIAVLNTTSRRLKGVKLSIGDGESFKKNESVISNLMPFCIKKVPIEIEVNKPIVGLDTISIPVEVSYKHHFFEDRLRLKIRKKGESYKITFISQIDNSCQYYAVMPPPDYDRRKKYALIFTLHGAGVEASGQVNAYQQKDWAFVVAPTNRRRFGFDWQDWGRLDALEVLELVKKAFPIDTSRVYLTGHSMGGHGTWHIALAHSDLFAAAAPEAGWSCFQLYVPWFLQKSYLFAEPQQIAIRDMSLREDLTPNFLENALNLPLFIYQGGSDDNVPPVHARLFARLLDELGYEYQYRELPGKGHWFEVDTVNHISCVDDPELMKFLKPKTRDLYPKHIIFKTTNIGQSHKSYWVEIDQQENPFFESQIEAEIKTLEDVASDVSVGRKKTKIKNNRIEINTKNISQFTLSLSEHLLPRGEILILINGEEISYAFKNNEKIAFSKRGDKFQIGESTHLGLKKSSSFYGPIKQAYFSPFVLVYGTKGDSATTELTTHQARLEATRWWRRANGFAEIIPDTEVTTEIMDEYNLILFGGAEENLITAKINENLPIKVKDGKILLGEKQIRGKQIAVELIYPNPLNPGRFVFVHEGNNLEGLKLSDFFTTIYSGAGLPDFVIFDNQVKQKGWGGVICAGFFDSDWLIDEKLLYLKE
jgi:pimeloyl-ACP methyl ester carboxylesterase